MHRKRTAIGFGFVAITVVVLLSAVIPMAPPGNTSVAPALGLDFSAGRVLLALLIVGGLMGSLAMLARKYFAKNLRSGKRIQIHESAVLAPKSRILLVSIDNRHFAFGVTEHSITTLAELTSDRPEDENEECEPEGQQHQDRFKTHLKRAYRFSLLAGRS